MTHSPMYALISIYIASRLNPAHSYYIVKHSYSYKALSLLSVFVTTKEKNMTTNIASLENKELIEKYEKLGVDLNKIFIELALRRENNDLTDLEWSQINDTAARRAAELVDHFNVDKKDIKEGFSHVADMLTDDNR